jgi:hypothetical protein
MIPSSSPLFAQEEDKMIEEALRRSMEELNQGSYWAAGDGGSGGGAPE